jgi:hypothetical protein
MNRKPVIPQNGKPSKHEVVPPSGHTPRIRYRTTYKTALWDAALEKKDAHLFSSVQFNSIQSSWGKTSDSLSGLSDAGLFPYWNLYTSIGNQLAFTIIGLHLPCSTSASAPMQEAWVVANESTRVL